MSDFLFLETAWPINTRTKRFFDSIAKKYSVAACVWNRDGNHKDSKDNIYMYYGMAKYGSKLQKLISLPGYIKFCSEVIKEENPKYIFASHWDSLLVACISNFFSRNKSKIIYDCLDLPTSKSRVLVKVLRFLEKRLLRRVCFTIFASRYFAELYDENLDTLVFENYPVTNFSKSTQSKPKWFDSIIDAKKSDVIYVSWIGVLRYEEILINILQAVAKMKGKVYLYVFGDGPALSFMQQKIIELDLESYVTLFGRYETHELPYIYDVTDLVWAAYPTMDFNTKYAISNKYHECNLFERQIVVSKNTKMALNKKGSKSIFGVDEYSVQSIIHAFNKIDNGRLSFEKYDEDITWQSREPVLFRNLERIMKSDEVK